MDQPAQNSSLSSSSASTGHSRSKNFLLTAPVIAIVILLILLGVFLLIVKGSFTAIEVDGVKVTQTFFNHRVAIQENFYKVVNPDAQKLASAKNDEAQEIIDTILVENELGKIGQKVTDGEVNKAIEDQMKSYEQKNPGKSYKDLLMFTYKMTMDDEKYVVKRQIGASKLANNENKKEIWGVWLTRPIPSDAPDKATADQKAADAKVRQLANQVLAEVNSGGDLSVIANKYSQDSISKAKGGMVGEFPNGSEAPFGQRSFAAMAVVASAYDQLGQGEAKVIEYPLGFGIMKVISVKGNWPFKDLGAFLQSARKSANIKINVKT